MLSMEELLKINVKTAEDNVEMAGFIEEYIDMVGTESVMDFGGYGVFISLEHGVGVESAIDGGNFGNKFMYYFSKLGNIFTRRQSGYNQVITQMQQINTGKISQGASNIALNVANANEYARITQAFNPKAGDLDTSKWQTLMNELDGAMTEARMDVLRNLWDDFKYDFLSGLAAGTVILFPLAIYFWFKSWVSFFKFWGSLYDVVSNKAEKGVLLAKGMELSSKIIVDIVASVYFKVCPDNPAQLPKELTISEVNRAVYSVVGKLKEFKLTMKRKFMVEYDEKVKAAQTVYNVAMSVYKEKLHIVSPSSIKAIARGSSSLTDKLFQSIQGYNELKVAVEAYKGLIVAAELYFDISNMVLLDLYKM
jgi:hypothetical protein